MSKTASQTVNEAIDRHLGEGAMYDSRRRREATAALAECRAAFITLGGPYDQVAANSIDGTQAEAIEDRSVIVDELKARRHSHTLSGLARSLENIVALNGPAERQLEDARNWLAIERMSRSNLTVTAQVA